MVLIITVMHGASSLEYSVDPACQAEAFRTLSMKARGPPGYEARLEFGMRLEGLQVPA